MAENKGDFKKSITALKDAQKEFLAVPFCKNGRSRNGNVSKGVQRKLEAALIDAGADYASAHNTAAKMAYDFRFKKTEQKDSSSVWEPASEQDVIAQDKKIIDSWKENNSGKELGLNKLFKSK